MLTPPTLDKIAALSRAMGLGLEPREVELVRDYVAACKMMGGSTRRIIVRHVMPNTIGTTIVNTTFSIAARTSSCPTEL